MNSRFLLTNRAISPNPLELSYDLNSCYMYCNKSLLKTFDDITILIDGYVLPRNNSRSDLSLKKFQYELVSELFRKHGENFIDYVKGFFCIVLIYKEQIYVFNDQLGLNKFFYFQFGETIFISNSYKMLYQQRGDNDKNINPSAICLKALLNREMNGQTIIDGIFFSQPATCVSIQKKKVTITKYWDHRTVRNSQNPDDSYQFFGKFLKNNVENFHQAFNPQTVAITLTGGKDSRTALCALLASGIKPFGITYGTPTSKDAVYAGKMAKAAGIDHAIVSPEKTSQWFEQAAMDIIRLDNPLINIHRSHRLSAFNHLHHLLGKDTAYYGGYLGGELLMGPYYDDLIFTRFVTDTWDTGMIADNIPEILHGKFVKPPKNLHGLTDHLSAIQTLNIQNSKEEMQFNGLFEIGILHHSQDLFMAGKILKYPIAFFLDLDFMCRILSSVYSYENKKNIRTANLIKRYGLYEFNLNLQHILYPALDHVPFAKKGSYNTKEFLKGPYYWSFVKALRYLLDHKKYSPTFSYNEAYKEFILKYLKIIREEKNSWVHDYYDVPSAIATLKERALFTQEKEWHPYSNIVMHYLQIKWYNDEI